MTFITKMLNCNQEAWDAYGDVNVFDFKTMLVPELTHEQLKSVYFPYIDTDGINISPVKKYVC